MDEHYADRIANALDSIAESLAKLTEDDNALDAIALFVESLAKDGDALEVYVRADCSVTHQNEC